VFPVNSGAPRSTVTARIPRIPPHTRILLIDDDPLLLKSLR
jgi:hypothetical protein